MTRSASFLSLFPEATDFSPRPHSKHRFRYVDSSSTANPSARRAIILRISVPVSYVKSSDTCDSSPTSVVSILPTPTTSNGSLPTCAFLASNTSPSKATTRSSNTFVPFLSCAVRMKLMQVFFAGQPRRPSLLPLHLPLPLHPQHRRLLLLSLLPLRQRSFQPFLPSTRSLSPNPRRLPPDPPRKRRSRVSVQGDGREEGDPVDALVEGRRLRQGGVDDWVGAR